MGDHEQKVPDGTHRSNRAPDSARQASWSTRRVVVAIGFLLLAFIGLFIYGYSHYLRRQRVVEADEQAAEDAPPQVVVEKVRRAAGSAELSLPGNLTPVTEAYIYARASGYVSTRYVDIGDRVRAGQLLAEIEAPEMDQQVHQARAALAQAEKQIDQANADLAEARARMELARVTWDRYKVLVEHGAVSRQDGDQQLAAFQSTSATVSSVEARIGSADQNVRASRANLERLLALQDYEKIRAPFGGIVTARNFDVGALISGSGASMGQGQGTATLTGPSTGAQGGELFRIAQIGVLRVLFNVPEGNARDIRVGEQALVSVQSIPGREFKGTVTRTSNAVDVSSRTMLTEVQVQNADLALLPGMFVLVRLINTRAEPPLVIPGDCVMTTGRGLRVAVLEDLQPQGALTAGGDRARSFPPGAKRIHLQEIRVGRDYGREIEVVSGLTGSESLVLNPGDEIEEGVVVQPVTKPKEAPPAQ